MQRHASASDRGILAAFTVQWTKHNWGWSAVFNTEIRKFPKFILFYDSYQKIENSFMLIIKLELDTDIVLFFSNIPLIVIVLPSAEWKSIHSRPKKYTLRLRNCNEICGLLKKNEFSFWYIRFKSICLTSLPNKDVFVQE